MAYNDWLKIPAHLTVYEEPIKERELEIAYSIPEAGTNRETKLILFVPGFGGNIRSNVYRKMREQFADEFNAVTVQCAYFGDQFMQLSTNTVFTKEYLKRLSQELPNSIYRQVEKNPEKLFEMLEPGSLVLTEEVMREDLQEFNDMGFMQAMDLMNALEMMKELLKQNNLSFNPRHVVGYGHSHGAYLLHLVNVLNPNLFSHIIDNSAWLVPGFLEQNRQLNQQVNGITISTQFNYYAKSFVYLRKALHLADWYTQIENRANLLIYQGNKDHLVNHREKEKIFQNVAHSFYTLITEKEVDNCCYFSNEHGLSADFLSFYRQASQQMKNLRIHPPVSEKGMYELETLDIVLNRNEVLTSMNLVVKEKEMY